MKVNLESTSKVVDLNNGVQARVWEGETERGVKVVALIPRIACKLDADQAQFLADLVEQRPPSAEVQAWPTRMVL